MIGSLIFVFGFVLCLLAVNARHYVPQSAIDFHKHHLRAQSVDVSLDQMVNMDGFFENAYYNYKCGMEINQKWTYKLDWCGPSFNYTNTWMTAVVKADPQWNTYHEWYTYYSDSSCTTVSTTVPAMMRNEGILLCANYFYGYMESKLTHAVAQPLVFETEISDYTMEIYSNAGDCAMNGFTGVVDIQYMAFGSCGGYNGFDLIINSCDSNGLTGMTFPSNNLLCEGTGTPITIAASSACTSSTANIEGYFNGYLNLVCSPRM